MIWLIASSIFLQILLSNSFIFDRDFEPDDLVGKKVANWKKYPGAVEELGNYFQGDILRSPKKFLRNGAADITRRWKNAIVPYVLGGNFDYFGRNKIQAAFKLFHDNSCVRFVPRTNETDYLSITCTETGCWSEDLGKIGGMQEVNIQIPGCHRIGSIMHEFLHVLGFQHEHNREDRDAFLTVKYENIDENEFAQFEIIPKGESNDFGVKYDFSSLMHYSAWAFSKNGKDTMVPKDKNATILGQRAGFSAGDLEKLNKMYDCKKFL